MEEKKTSVAKKTVLWIFAVIIMMSAFVYQKRTGPTYPYRGSFEIEGQSYKHRLVRSEETIKDAEVILPKGDYDATLHYRRYKTQDEFMSIPLENKEETKLALLPKQPAAGKLEYYLTVGKGEQQLRIPKEENENILIRFKDPVPMGILIPHITFMFFAMLIGMRAALGAIFAVDSMRVYVWISLVGMTVGGMALGPIVQKYAFGEYWTGFPWGGDWTDNKMLIMWLAWLVAASVVGFKQKKKETIGRLVVVVAAIVMTIVYIIPHSTRGSELDYSKVDAGIDPAKAIHTGQ